MWLEPLVKQRPLSVIILLSFLLFGCLTTDETGQPVFQLPRFKPAAKETRQTATQEELTGTGTGQVAYYTTIGDFELITGRKIEIRGQSPNLQSEVKAGRLPALTQRVPEEPLVIHPVDEIGRYGGVLTQPHWGIDDWLRDMLREFPLMYSSDMNRIVPNIFKGWEISANARVHTFHIRRGIKWDDGRPLTAGDFLFYINDVYREIDSDTIEGEVSSGQWKILDDYTLSATYPSSFGVLNEYLCRWRPEPYLPAQYMKQFHPAYTSSQQLESLISERGFASWTELFESERNWYDNPDIPTIMAWKAQNRQSADIQIFERNPYYWKIDVMGKQLPYIDAIHRPYVSSEESVLQMALNGEVEYLDGEILGFSANYDRLSENALSGGYRLVTAPGWATMVGLIAFNYSHADPVLRDLFLNRDFRTALSLSIDRDQINQQLFDGRYVPAQASPSDGPPYHGEGPEFHRFTEYDPTRANKILDGLGLQWDR